MTLIMPVGGKILLKPVLLGNNLRILFPRAEKIISPENFSTESDKCINNDSVDKEKKMLLILSHKLVPKQEEEARQRFGISKFLPMPMSYIINGQIYLLSWRIYETISTTFWNGLI